MKQFFFFDTHVKLDMYVLSMRQQKKLSEGEEDLLKAFDRAFWLRYDATKWVVDQKEELRGKTKDELRKELAKYVSPNCPFNDPKTTGSNPIPIPRSP